MMQLYQGDCLEVLRTLPDASVDAVIADPPYGTTGNPWDSTIPLGPLWHELLRVARKKAPIALFAAQPFTTTLIASQSRLFKYTWVWEKNRPTDKFNAKNRPMRKHEDIVVFSEGTTANCSPRRMPYFPQGLQPCAQEIRGTTGQWESTRRPSHKDRYVLTATGYPHTLLRFPKDDGDHQHNTQKPVALMAYLVRTYTNPGEMVLDFCMGSGTTGVACVQEGRRFIGVERDAGYFAIAERRIATAQPPLPIAEGATA